ncbi:carbon-nitrogen hydrolase family protein (plasmid) [Rhizobium sullae]|uniref:Carbon-nitrogen hydrolase family protein n=1 Tax=Rhizobium sullae TaxID=50338 RepID=A0A2N0DGK1_RHISU|nr:carbon-nitrogen hydrolase family protein [Rhizobium sullae]PKA45228.1 carbon-nitrogen hydrolase family protein [Rhizobium sullae]UWU17258.1 carbon-nitrogen hydrolase family protein [Rhizobium sullae]
MKTVRIAAAQTPEFRDQIEAATQHAIDAVGQAEENNTSLICFPECFLQGYLTDELSARRVAVDLRSDVFGSVLRRLSKARPMIVFGLIEIEDGRIFNTAVVVKRGVLVGRYRKQHLLDREQAVFDVGNDAPIFEVDGLRFGINICYDTNFPEAARKVAELGASLIVCCANNMMPRQKAEAFKDLHNAVRGDRCRETGLWIISADVTGERDERIAWGPTAILNPEGQVVAQLSLGEPGLLFFDIPCGE